MSPLTGGPTGGVGGRGPADPRQLYAVFRPLRGRLMAIWIGIGQGLLFLAIATFAPWSGPGAFAWYDRLVIVAISAAIGVLLSRFALLRAQPGPDGLEVRNLAGERRLAWAEILTVRFGGGNPWVSLDLADGEALAVMAIQRADGARAEKEARRLATLVDLHSRTERDD